MSTTCQNQPGLPLSTAKGRCPGTGGRWPGLSSSTQQPWLLPVGHQACLPVHTPAVRELDQDPPFCYNGESSKFPFTGYCKATDINNCEILCLPKPYKYIKNKNTTATLSEKRGVTSCLGGSQLIPCVRCAGLLPAAKENKEHHPNLKSQTFWNVLPIHSGSRKAAEDPEEIRFAVYVTGRGNKICLQFFMKPLAIYIPSTY